MKRLLRIITMVFALIVILSDRLFAQSLPVGTPVLDDYYRRMQLLGKVDSNVSFSVRPIFTDALKIINAYDPDSTLTSKRIAITNNFAKGQAVLRLLPLTWQQQFNSHHPYGW